VAKEKADKIASGLENHVAATYKKLGFVEEEPVPKHVQTPLGIMYEMKEKESKKKQTKA
jgi:hypothetical protein